MNSNWRSIIRYCPSEFENMFSKHAETFPDKLSYGEMWSMTEANREAFDLFGWYESSSSSNLYLNYSCDDPLPP